MRMRPVAAGTLPEDLLHAIRSGSVTLRQVSDDCIVFCDASGGVEWHCDLGAGETCAYRHQRTGESGTAHIPHFSAVKKTTPERRNESAPRAGTPVNTSPPSTSDVPKVTATLSDVMQHHRSLAMKVVHFLAPAPRDHEALLRCFSSESRDALNAVLGVLTVVNKRGQRELEMTGYELVDIESYDSKATKQRVANLALPKIAHNKAVLERFTLYADRDVMLAVCSKGGVMAGLGRSKRRRDDDDDSDGAEGDEKVEKPKAEKTEPKAATALFTSMDQGGVSWDDGDLSKEPWVMSSAAREVLARWQQAEAERTSDAGPASRCMPIANQSQLKIANDNYAILWKEYQLAHDLARRVNEVNEAARRWCQLNAERFADGLFEQLRRWFEAQEGPRAALIASLDTLHRALYQLKREIEDYVNLREWGVLS